MTAYTTVDAQKQSNNRLKNIKLQRKQLLRKQLKNKQLPQSGYLNNKNNKMKIASPSTVTISEDLTMKRIYFKVKSKD